MVITANALVCSTMETVFEKLPCGLDRSSASLSMLVTPAHGKTVLLGGRSQGAASKACSSSLDSSVGDRCAFAYKAGDRSDRFSQGMASADCRGARFRTKLTCTRFVLQEQPSLCSHCHRRNVTLRTLANKIDTNFTYLTTETLNWANAAKATNNNTIITRGRTLRQDCQQWVVIFRGGLWSARANRFGHHNPSGATGTAVSLEIRPLEFACVTRCTYICSASLQESAIQGNI